MVKIAFALPVPNSKIIGGYKVVYEYANYIAKKNCDVTILYNAHQGDNSQKLPRWFVFLLRWYIGRFGPNWFKLDKNIHKKVFPIYDNQSFDGFDIVIATATETATYVNQADKSIKKYYFVQDFEDWGIPEEAVLATYKMDMNIVTISMWLKRIIDEVALNKSIYIPNGIDKTIFNVNVPYNNRGKHSLSTLYHWDKRKACDISLDVIFKLKERYPDFEAFLFGAPNRESNWPDWIHYIHDASPIEVSTCMNNARVFLCTSRQEGFGLTGLESIFCGCTLVTTDCKGIREYASDNNSYLCEIDNVDDIFKSVCDAFDNEETAYNKRQNCSIVTESFNKNHTQDLFYRTVVFGE